MTYEVKLLKSDEGYAVYCPALPGCHLQGGTEDEAVATICDAMVEYLADVADEERDALRTGGLV